MTDDYPFAPSRTLARTPPKSQEAAANANANAPAPSQSLPPTAIPKLNKLAVKETSRLVNDPQNPFNSESNSSVFTTAEGELAKEIDSINASVESNETSPEVPPSGSPFKPSKALRRTPPKDGVSATQLVSSPAPIQPIQPAARTRNLERVKAATPRTGPSPPTPIKPKISPQSKHFQAKRNTPKISSSLNPNPRSPRTNPRMSLLKKAAIQNAQLLEVPVNQVEPVQSLEPNAVNNQVAKAHIRQEQSTVEVSRTISAPVPSKETNVETTDTQSAVPETARTTSYDLLSQIGAIVPTPKNTKYYNHKPAPAKMLFPPGVTTPSVKPLSVTKVSELTQPPQPLFPVTAATNNIPLRTPSKTLYQAQLSASSASESTVSSRHAIKSTQDVKPIVYKDSEGREVHTFYSIQLGQSFRYIGNDTSAGESLKRNLEGNAENKASKKLRVA
ncbi:hypothetical protein BKA69DRAFT_1120763 [Paraphysoderma sedebokerense]|nr:hypothetical protein BKA69DRAFT_1120763 [Paraphysoderma sedebokerense]